MPTYQQKQKHVQHRFLSSKKVLQQHTVRKSKSVKNKEAQPTEVMAEPAYTVPAFRERSTEENQEYRRAAAFLGRELHELQYQLNQIKVATHAQVENIALTREVEKRMSVKKQTPEMMDKAPDFLVNLRSHTIWEKSTVKLFCTVQGKPAPIVQWYKGEKVVNPLDIPGKYKIENKYGVHALIISRCTVGDTALYSAVATNPHGKATSKATVTVKRMSATGDLSWLPGSVPITPTHASKLDVTLLDKFGVTFGAEGETCKLVCTLNVVPDLPNLPPEVMWFKDDTLLAPCKWLEMAVSGSAASLTFPHLNKDDEGLYTLRIWTKDGTAEHSAYLFVRDAVPNVAGSPGAPMDVKATDVNKDYVLVTWKPPNITTEAAIKGYFVDRREVGSSDWKQCNDSPVNVCKYPVHGLKVGHSYHFRVRAVNSSGISRPSRRSDGVTTLDVTESKIEGVPSAPGRVVASRNTKTSAFVQWDPPKHPNNLMGYYIDASVVGSKTWTPCNHRPFKHTRFVVHGLVQGETYVFRVQAVNTYGLSDESQESDPLFIDAALSAPSVPYGISLLNCDGSSMTIGWKQPKNTGGTKITAYYVDKREAESLKWSEVNPTPTKERIYKVENLTTGKYYEFKVQAGNLAGVGVPSEPSRPFLCEAWMMALPGPVYDFKFSEVRDNSLVVQWKAPLYTGQSAVTSYYLERAKKGSSEFVAVNEEPINHRFMKVTGLEKGERYVFRVRAVNAEGIGMASDISQSVVAKALTGMKEIECGVDAETGDVFLSFEACEISQTSKFVWSKSYKEITQSERVTISTQGRQSKLTFTNPDEMDLGIYSVAVTDTDRVSSSHTLTEEDMKKMLELSYNIKNPVVPLKTVLNYEILEKGHVRFWLQAQKMSSAVSYRFIVNDKAVTSGEGTKISHDVSTGVIQMTVDHFTKANEGTYTVQLTDGKAKAQTSLVLVGDVFKAALKEAEFQRKEHIRKQGPHFSEYLSFYVADDCTVMLTCKLANVKKETAFHWYKEEEEIVLDVAPNVMSGSCTLPIPMFSRKDQGIYKATLSDDRGKDTSVYEIFGKVFEDIINAIAQVSGSSMQDLVLQCTPEGIRLQCYMKYYTEEMKTHWFHKESKIASSEKMRIGGTAEMAWMQICEPTDREKGQYTIEIQDATKSYSRSFDLSGQAYTDAYAEFQRLKAAAFAEKNRGRVVGGLPDVVTIMEKKSLSLTCTVWGDPSPEVTWFKNEQEVVSDAHNKITFEGGRFASLTINTVTVEDSGKYSINVRNKYGGEFVEITVSVYKQGEDIPEPKLGQMSKPKATPPPASMKSPTPTPPPSIKSPTPTPPPSVKSPTPSPAPKSPTPPRSAKSPTPPRFVKSPTPPRK
ncbi:myomesin-2 isoform X2 [Denticeps clupeoides]|uniref:Myomesin-2-like n=1 Tax=Denticeps clupeoides TaxID=299321 RepID=A0AAY4AEU4_9TELE|nr:myomesin-2-like isoform X2 [Denticeps clupeoides]